MNTTHSIKREIVLLEKAIRKASRILLEMEVRQSEWEYKHGKGKVYKSTDDFMRHIMKKVNS